MKHIISYLINMVTALLVIFTLSACQEVYYPDIKDTGELILVVDGKMDNTAGPHKVSLSYANPFGTDKQGMPITNAMVQITGEEGNSWTLSHRQSGTYATKTNQLTGEVGKSYKLYIRLQNGLVYESGYETIHPPLKDINISGESGEVTFQRPDSYGNITTFNRTCCNLNLSAKNEDTSRYYLRTSTTYLLQYYYEWWYPFLCFTCEQPYPVPVHIWKPQGYLNEIPFVQESGSINEKQRIPGWNIGILVYPGIDDSTATETSSVHEPRGWVTVNDIYRITENAWRFNKNIVDQLGSENYIFDPIPSKTHGNVKCTNDTSQTTIGLFETASKITIIKAFLMTVTPAGEVELTSKELESYDMPYKEGRQDTIPPDFWIEF